MRASERSMNYVRKQGWIPWVVERFIGQAGRFGKRIDLFNIIDIVAIHPKNMATLGIQSTTRSQIREHLITINENSFSRTWLAHPTRRLVVHGWDKYQGHWRCKEVEIILNHANGELETT
jgi:hypothetical protein